MMTSTNNMNQAITATTDDYHDRQYIDQQQQQHYQQQQQQHEQPACKTDNNIKQADENITSDNDDDDQQPQYQTTSVNNLGPYDVICGRGSVAFNNIGNRRFRILIGLNVDQYSAADGRQRKGQFIGSLVRTIMHEMGTKFYKMKNKGQLLTELTETQIRKKVGHALRDTLAFQESQEKNHQQQNSKNKTATKAVSNNTTSTKKEPIIAPTGISWSSVAVSSMIRSHLNRSKTNSNNSNNHVASTVTIPKILSCPPPPVPPTLPVVFFNPMFQQEPSLNKVDCPSSPQGGGDRRRRETRASINTGTYPLILGGGSSFPVSVNEQHQQLRQQQQQQQQQLRRQHRHQQRRSLSATSTASSTGQVIHKSISVLDKKLFIDLEAADRKQKKRIFEEWLLWSENTNTNSNSNNNDNDSNNNNSSETIDCEKMTEDDIDPFEDIDFIPIPIENIVHQDQDQDQDQY